MGLHHWLMLLHILIHLHTCTAIPDHSGFYSSYQHRYTHYTHRNKTHTCTQISKHWQTVLYCGLTPSTADQHYWVVLRWNHQIHSLSYKILTNQNCIEKLKEMHDHSAYMLMHYHTWTELLNGGVYSSISEAPTHSSMFTMPEDKYPKMLFSQDWDIEPRRCRQRKVLE